MQLGGVSLSAAIIGEVWKNILDFSQAGSLGRDCVCGAFSEIDDRLLGSFALVRPATAPVGSAPPSWTAFGEP